jgi:hypothetical protein
MCGYNYLDKWHDGGFPGHRPADGTPLSVLDVPAPEAAGHGA